MGAGLSADRSTQLSIGAVLAFVGGLANAVAFKQLGTYIGNMTGTVTSVGLRVTGEVSGDPLDSLKLIFSFMSGSFLSGALIPTRCASLSLTDSSYELSLFLNTVLFILTWMHCKEPHGKYIACVATGLLNGISSLWCGGMRTTHSTGTITDIGIGVGRSVSRFLQKGLSSKYDDKDWADTGAEVKKVAFMTVLLLGLMCGAIVGSMLYKEMGERAFLVAAGITGAITVAHTLKRTMTPQKTKKG